MRKLRQEKLTAFVGWDKRVIAEREMEDKKEDATGTQKRKSSGIRDDHNIPFYIFLYS